MTRFADFIIYILCGIVALAALIGVFGHSSHTAFGFFRLVQLSMFALLAWAAIKSLRKQRWLMAVIAVICIVIVASQTIAPRDSPLGMHEAGFWLILPFLTFENAGAKAQKIVTLLALLTAVCVVLVNSGVVGFGTTANAISAIVIGVLVGIIGVRIATKLRSASPASQIGSN